VILAETPGQIVLPRNKSRTAGAGAKRLVFIPLTLQQRLVGDENVDVLFERFESPSGFRRWGSILR
jgi:hypothetical protein